MKVLLVNGSPNEHGCTFTALSETAKTLEECGIETGFWQLGQQPVQDCIACNSCVTAKRCVFDDRVNEFTALAKEYDGFVFGSPVYYSGMTGSLKSFMDRAFYSASRMDPHPFRLKPAAAVVSARRGGTTAALDQMNKFLLHQQMLVPGSRYWNMVHGKTAEDVLKDEEGLQIMRVLGRNLAWLLKLIEAGKTCGVPLPPQEPVRILTNFIR